MVQCNHFPGASTPIDPVPPCRRQLFSEHDYDAVILIGGDSVPQEGVGRDHRACGLHAQGGVLLASGGWRPGAPLHAPQGRGQVLPADREPGGPTSQRC